MRVLVACLVLVTAAFATPSRATPKAPPASTWAELEAVLPPGATAKEQTRRLALLLRFASDEQPSLADRQHAARVASATCTGAHAPRQRSCTEAALAEARLFAIAGAPEKRRSVLRKALAHAKKQAPDDVATLAGVLEADDVLAAYRRLPKHPKAAAALTSAMPAWLSAGDERQHAVARVALAKNEADPFVAERTLADVLDALGQSRDAAAVRADAGHALAALLARNERWSDAVAASIAADRAAALEPRAPVSSSSSRHVRSRRTAELCRKTHGTPADCALVEKARWSTRTFHDFSRQKPARAFDTETAAAVMDEYDSELHACLKQGAKAGLTTDTHLELVWSVGNDGKVLPAFDLRPSRLRGTDVETCLASALALFRYRPYRGEMRHVQVSFDVGE